VTAHDVKDTLEPLGTTSQCLSQYDKPRWGGREGRRLHGMICVFSDSLLCTML
jgi:hypothetical protein